VNVQKTVTFKQSEGECREKIYGEKKRGRKTAHTKKKRDARIKGWVEDLGGGRGAVSRPSPKKRDPAFLRRESGFYLCVGEKQHRLKGSAKEKGEKKVYLSQKEEEVKGVHCSGKKH